MNLGAQVNFICLSSKFRTTSQTRLEDNQIYINKVFEEHSTGEI